MDKNKVWNSRRRFVNKICDGLQKPIDEGIKETVTAFHVLGIKTTASCEGHDNWGHPFPWIDVKCDLRNAADPKLKDYILVKIKLIELIDEFYLTRTPLPWSRIIIHHYATWLRIQSIVGEIAKCFPKDSDEFRQVRKNTTEEMSAFTNFLKQKFFSS